MAILGWGKPRIILKKEGETDWHELPTPVENSTQLATSKGDKKEAKIEGGENEDVKYTKNTYALNLNIRAAKGRKRPLNDSDGVIAGNYEIVLQPEDPTAIGFHIKRSTASVEDTFTTEEGGIWAYTFDALKPSDGGDQVEWGVVTITSDSDGISEVTVTPIEEE